MANLQSVLETGQGVSDFSSDYLQVAAEPENKHV